MSKLLENPTPEAVAWQQLHATASGQASIVVAFTGIVLESYIHSYSRRKLGAGFTDAHTHQMPFVTKWLVVPRLATGVEMPDDHPALHALRTLSRARYEMTSPTMEGAQDSEHPEVLPPHSLQGQDTGEIMAALNAPYCLAALGQFILNADPDEAFAKLLTDAFKNSKPHRLRNVDA